MIRTAILAPTNGASEQPATNPFATRFTRPGAIPFDFGGRSTIAELIERLRLNDWRGAIVGPHGTGKSTLLATLVPKLEAADRKVILLRLHGGQRRLPKSLRELELVGPASILVVDGFEQLGRLQRWRMHARCRRFGCGLLVTSHADCRMPVLFRTRPELPTVEQLIERDLPPHGGRICQADIERSWRRQSGNVREVLFELYDLFETRRRL